MNHYNIDLFPHWSLSLLSAAAVDVAGAEPLKDP